MLCHLVFKKIYNQSFCINRVYNSIINSQEGKNNILKHQSETNCALHLLRKWSNTLIHHTQARSSQARCRTQRNWCRISFHCSVVTYIIAQGLTRVNSEFYVPNWILRPDRTILILPICLQKQDEWRRVSHFTSWKYTYNITAVRDQIP